MRRRRWMDERGYADLVALCQFLPGPASSQVGFAVGLLRAGYRGGLAAWLGFTLPSALALMAVGLGLGVYVDQLSNGLLQGLKIAAAAVVAHAVWSMARSLCPDIARVLLMLGAAALVLFSSGPVGPVAAIVVAGLAGWALFKPPESDHAASQWAVPVSRRAGLGWLALLALLLGALPLLVALFPLHWLAVTDAFFRVGSLVFGGGHVVLPLLQAEVVTTGWVDEQLFLAGYGLAQAVPGPLFTFAAFLGAAMEPAPNGWAGALIGLLAIFAPSFLLVAGVLPFWTQVRESRPVRAALMAINAAVVGILLAALIDPIAIAVFTGPASVALTAMAVVALMKLRWPPWLIVILCATAGWALGLGSQ